MGSCAEGRKQHGALACAWSRSCRLALPMWSTRWRGPSCCGTSFCTAAAWQRHWFTLVYSLLARPARAPASALRGHCVASSSGPLRSPAHPHFTTPTLLCPACRCTCVCVGRLQCRAVTPDNDCPLVHVQVCWASARRGQVGPGGSGHALLHHRPGLGHALRKPRCSSVCTAHQTFCPCTVTAHWLLGQTARDVVVFAQMLLSSP